MDLIISILLIIILSSIKSTNNFSVPTYIIEEGNTEKEVKDTTEYKIGNNLLLKRERDAYHKILKELGLT